VAMNRLALEAIVQHRPPCRDDDGSPIPLVFNCEIVNAGARVEWLGEDFSFFEQTRGLVAHYALLRGETDHAGALVDLDDVRKLFCPA
jgi:hypothetical protein